MFILILAFFLFSPPVLGQTVISNSQDWRDVYSVTLYSNLEKLPSYFLVSKRHSTLLFIRDFLILFDNRDVIFKPIAIEINNLRSVGFKRGTYLAIDVAVDQQRVDIPV